MKNLLLLMASLFILSSCSVEDDMYDDYGSNSFESKSYALRVGTSFLAKGSIYTPEDGSIILEKFNGTSTIRPNATINAHGTVTVSIESQTGESRTRVINYDEYFNLDEFGDFYVDFKYDTRSGEVITGIDSVNMMLTHVSNSGSVFEKRIRFTNSIWSIGSSLVDLYQYEVSHYGTKYWAGSQTHSTYIDINADLVLKQVE